MDLNRNDANEWEIMKHVYELLVEENVFQAPAEQPVVDFKYPDELNVSSNCNCMCFYKLENFPSECSTKQIMCNVFTFGIYGQ